jgi:hypothetical protein
VERLDEPLPGTRYTFREMVLRRGLTRQVVAGFQFLYRDGTSEYIPASTGRLERGKEATGLLAGTSRTWEPVVASAVARKALSKIRVFAVDPGARPLGGVVYLDTVSLSASPGPDTPTR